MESQKPNHKSKYDIDDLLADGGDVSIDLEEDYDEHGLDWQQTKRYAQDTKLRTNLTRWVQWLIPAWLALVMAVLIMSMFCGDIDSSVLIALLTTTTVNIIGLPYIVLKGLFDK